MEDAFGIPFHDGHGALGPAMHRNLEHVFAVRARYLLANMH